MKTKEFEFSITKPCNEDWNSMAITPKGKHCGQCSKQVIDATGFGPEEIFSILNEHRGNVCMRMRPELLDKPFTVPANHWYDPITRYYKKAALFIGMQFLFLNQIKAQVVNAFMPGKNTDGIVKKYLKSVTISGAIADSFDKKPIPYVKVQVRKNEKIIGSTVCKFDGTYTIDLKDSIEDNSPASIEFLNTMFDAAEIMAFSFNKPYIIIDTVFLNRSLSIVNEIGINTYTNSQDEHSMRVASLNKLVGGMGCVYVKSSSTENPTPNTQLKKYIKDVDHSPRPSRFDIKGED